MGMGAGMGRGNLDQLVTTDLVPASEVSVRRGDRVLATDGEIGWVQGLVIAPTDHQVTHVLLQEGHLFGRVSGSHRCIGSQRTSGLVRLAGYRRTSTTIPTPAPVISAPRLWRSSLPWPTVSSAANPLMIFAIGAPDARY